MPGVLSLPPPFENPTSLALCFVAGALFYAGISQLFIGFRRKIDPIHLVFASACFLLGIGELAAIGTYKSTSLENYVYWLKLETRLSLLAAISLVWFITFYMDIKKVALPLAISTLHFVYICLDFWFPYGVWFSNMKVAEPFQLFWGEYLFDTQWTPHPWTLYLDLMAQSFPLYFLYGLYHKHWVLKQRIDFLFVGVIATMALTVVHDTIFRSFGPFDLSTLGFVLLILYMGYDLSRKIQDSETRNRILIDHSLEGIYRIDFRRPIPIDIPVEEQVRLFFQEAYMGDCNQVYASIYGLKSKDDVIGKSPGEMWADESGLAEGIKYWITNGYKFRQNEAMIQVQDGSEHWLMDSNIGIIEKNKLIRIWGVQLDITPRKRVEEALKESEETLRVLVESSEDWIWSIDAQGVHTYSNPAIENILGYPPDHLVGRSSTDFMHEEDRAKVAENWPVWLAKKEGWRGFLIRWRHKDGSYRHLESNAVPILDSSGELLGYRGMDRDITDRMRALQEREKLEDQLRQSQKMEAIGQLAGGIAHDFNNLLQAIRGYLSLTLQDMEPENPHRENIEEVQKAAERATVLTRQLLAFGRRQLIQPENLDLNEVLSELLKLIQRVIGEHIALEIIPGHQLSMVHADRGQIEQVLMNLCVNARDAMPQGGKISLETENLFLDSDYCEEHEWAIPGRYVLLSVTDTGCGMEAKVLPHIFEPFFTTKDVGAGTGLGLSTVYGIIRQHDGMVHVYSEPGLGTTFKFYLPSVEREASAVGDKIEEPARGGTETILLAEDDEAVRNLAKRILEESGYTVLAVADGEEAISLFEEGSQTIHMALLDVVMPKSGGRAVYDRIRQTAPGMRFLFATGYSVSGIHVNFTVEEGIEVIQKPYDASILLRKVRGVLDCTV